MAGNGQAPANGYNNCFNRGEPGHFSRWCLKRGQRPVGNAIVPVQAPAQAPLLTLPSTSGETPVVTTNQHFNRGGGWVRTNQRVEVLEGTVAMLKNQHDAEEEKERAKKEEEEKLKRERSEEERRQRDKKEREDFQTNLVELMNSKLNLVVEKLGGNKGVQKEKSELEIMKTQLAELQRTKTQLAELQRTKTQLAELQRTKTTAGSSRDDPGLVERLLQEQDELRKRLLNNNEKSERRLVALEERLLQKEKEKEDMAKELESWKQEALRLGNKRGHVVVSTPTSDARVRPRVTSRSPAVIRSEQYREMCQRNAAEVELLKEMRLKELNRRREAEQELEKYKEMVARAEAEKIKTPVPPLATDLRAKLDAVAEKSMMKSNGRKVTEETEQVNDKDMFVKENRKELRKKNKDEITSICRKEGVTYTTLEATKELIVQRRAERAFEGETSGKGKEVMVEVYEDHETGKQIGSKVDGCDSASS
ncbi:hypothetical protein CBR_g634 [Chara braunii]|uniref:CCHC-type domain-containing protein n=2 Tax=Chara braunii TaxID=69332 RepID=A0A388KBU2_CHABU|nr:hypothetical protein CBR_g634 [Chara braunii]|eukprot:GBG67499.1 hypothetical protein CBR_g634 [Chara braunii]